MIIVMARKPLRKLHKYCANNTINKSKWNSKQCSLIPQEGKPLPAYRRVTGSLPPGCPIRKSTDYGIFAPLRGLSQLVTSFFASESQGIPHAPLVDSVYLILLS